MKKFITALLLLFIVLSNTTYAAPIDVNKAKKVAENYLKLNSKNLQFTDSLKFVRQLTKNNSVYYVFSNNECYAIVAADDDAANPILAYSTEYGFSTYINRKIYNEESSLVQNKNETRINSRTKNGNLSLADDSYSGYMNASITLNPLFNDVISSACGAVSPTFISGPYNGSISQIGTTSTYTYNPNTDFIGNDSVSYAVTCNGTIDTAWIRITVKDYTTLGCPSITIGDGEDIHLECATTTRLNAFVAATATNIEGYTVKSIPFNPPYAFNTGTPILVGCDDVWSLAVNLPFKFCFYENTYDKVYVGANGVLTFNVDMYDNENCGDSLRTKFCEYLYGSRLPIPNRYFPIKNAIYGVYEDIDPRFLGTGGGIFSAVLGEYPCRTYCVSWNNIMQYNYDSPSSLMSTYQIVLYEGTNIIDVYVDKRQCCSAIERYGLVGVQNANGTDATAAPNRNGGRWSTTREAWRFTPKGTPNSKVTWLENSGSGWTEIGTGNTIDVNPITATKYIAGMEYTACNGDSFKMQDTIEITVKNVAIDSIINAKICNGSTYKDKHFEESVYGTYCDTIYNASGCDSLRYTLHLGEIQAKDSTITATICKGEIYSNTMFNNKTETGIYRDTLRAQGGCDSIIFILNLTVNKPDTVVDTRIACDSLIWLDGKTYRESNNTAQYTLKNSVGCDSLVILNLTINKTTHRVDEQTTCDSLIWLDGKTYRESNNTAQYILTNSVGCDSIITLNLEVNYSQKTKFDTVINDHEVYDKHGFYENEDGIFYQYLQTYYGCDSTVILNLKVKPTIQMPDAIDPSDESVNRKTMQLRNQFGPVISGRTTEYEYKMSIFDRFNTLIFETNKLFDEALDPTKHYWNGKFKGKTLPEGAYLYHVKVGVKKIGDVFEKKGIVSIIYK